MLSIAGINVFAVIVLVLLIAIGIHFWLFGERTETHQEEKMAGNSNDSDDDDSKIPPQDPGPFSDMDKTGGDFRTADYE